MKNILLLPAGILALLLTANNAQAQTMLYALTTANTIVTIPDVNTPSRINGPYNISGIAPGQAITSLATRRSNGTLYLLGYDTLTHVSQLYWVSQSGTAFNAHLVGNQTTAMNLGGVSNIAIDFAPTGDNQLRVAGRNGSTYLLNTDNGTIISKGQSTVNYAAGDTYAGTNTKGGAAFTGGFSGANTAGGVGYDAAHNVLVAYNAGNTSNANNNNTNNTTNSNLTNSSYTVQSIGTGTGVTFTSNSGYGMDSRYDNAAGGTMMYMTGHTVVNGNRLYKYKLNGANSNGILIDMGPVGGGATDIRDIAFAIDGSARPQALTNDVNAGSNLVVYPNPVVSQTKITLPLPSKGAVNVNVVDFNGNVVRKYSYNAGSATLDLDMSRLPAGIYSVRVQQQGES
ncbi:MAG: DUF4394 domain-containing protein, partial [Taibaiella sp.]|nr:DUF4394 domain-containing protein [Taibaiella sp.]